MRAAVLLVAFAGPAAAADRPNVVFVLSDDLAQGDVGCYGQKLIQTPHLDAMAAAGTRFTQAYCGTSVCAPSRASLMTGRHTGHAAIRANREVQPEGQKPLPAGTYTVAKLFQENGYATACVGKWGMGLFDTPGSPLKVGFDHFFGYNCQRHAHSYFPEFLYRDAERFPLPGNDGKGVGKTYAQNLIADETLAWVTANKNRPFFLFYAVTLPHGRHEIDDQGVYKNEPWTEQQKTYAAQVTRLDADVGRLLAKLKELGLDEKTLVVVAGDNGSSFAPGSEIGKRFDQTMGGTLRGFKRTLYEGGLRQACVARRPGVVPAGRVCHDPWAFWDFLPTCADVLGAKLPAGVETDGLSVLPLLTGGPAPKRECFYWELHENGSASLQAVRFGDWKAVKNGPSAKLELYDLTADPGERTDRAAGEPMLVERATKLMAANRTAHPDWPLRSTRRMNSEANPMTRILALAVAVCVASPAAADPPNVVLIVADDMGYADAGCYGATDVRTPHLDRLAAEGTRFTSFTVAQAVCTASRAALLAGCYPNRLGLAGALNHTSRVGVHPDEELLPELLKAKGYATALFGKWHLGTRPMFAPTRNGFDVWAGLPYSNDNGPLHPTVRGLPPLPFFDNDTVAETDPDQSRLTRRLTDKAVAFVRANKARPFFLYVPHVMPHVPVFASPAFRGKSARGVYGDAIEELDWSVGAILAAVKEAGLDDRTLVLFLSDNGPFLSYGSHAGSAGKLREGKLTAFEGGVRVPGLARWPGKVPAGRMCDDLVTGLDLLPTLAAITGCGLPKKPIDGVDLSPLLLGKPGATGRPSLAYYSGSELHAVRAGRWKLHLAHPYLTVDGPPGTGGKPANVERMKPTGIEESGIRGIASRHGYKVMDLPQSLFDLTADPGETTDVSAANPGVVRELAALAAAFRTDLGDALTAATGTGLRPVRRDDH